MVQITAYPVPLTPSIIKIFKHFAAFYYENRRPLSTSRIISKWGVVPEGKRHCVDYNNWSQLAHHGLISQTGDLWRVTKRGEEFYLGKIQIPSVAGVWRGKALGETIAEDAPVWEQWEDTKNMRRRLVTIDDIAPPDHQPNREEFADIRYSASNQ